MSDYIPAELWPTILKFLPVKTLLQCTAVSKSWNSIITSPAFISDHLAAASRRLFVRSSAAADPQAFSLRSNPDPSLPSLDRSLSCPFRSKTIHISFRVVGSVDGLVCVSDDILGYTYRLIVWNPSIRRSISLPEPGFNYDSVGPYHFAVGFGFDSATSDYKAVRVVYAQGTTDDEKYKSPPLVEVCSLRDLRWRRVGAEKVDYVITELVWTQCFIHGAVHWVASRRNNGFRNVILLFDLGTEVFKIMKLPECLMNLPPLRLSVSVIGGSLAVLDREFKKDVIRRRGFGACIGGDDNSYCKIHVWVKGGYGKGGSWSKILTVDEDWDVSLALRLSRLVGELMTGSRDSDCNDLQLAAAYNVFRFSTNPFFAFSFPESLVLLGKENGEDAYRVSKDEEVIESHNDGEESGASSSESGKISIGRSLMMLATHAIMANSI